jgi:mRNA-degrading endonuclease YafQ of YafQ-DinJ toxin-antitoxin module
MSDTKSDKLRGFIFGWTALEILVHKAFRTYVDQFLAPVAQAEHVKLREQFLRRLKEVMNDKYRLTDEFLVVTSILFPDVPTEKVESDTALFERLKTVRDALLHGKAVDETSLPVSELQGLLQRYVLAHPALR